MAKLKPRLTTKTTPQHKHDVFIEEYIRTLNATQAAIAAGYTKTNARQRGWELLHDPDIHRRIQTLMAQRSEQCGVDTQFVIEQTKALVLDPSTPAKDKAKALDLLGRYTQAWSGVQVKQDTTIEVKLSD